MNFAPHHRFAACELLEQRIEALRQQGVVMGNVYGDYLRYHFSLLHKLQSARYHVETLEAFLSSQNAQQTDPASLIYRVNFHFDGFLHVVGSALDILAREVLGYFAQVPPGNVYHHTAHHILNAARAGDAVLPFLTAPTWKQEFSTYRNTATHESIIGRHYSVNFEMVGHKANSRVVFPVPDDPRVHPPTFQRNPDIVHYCQMTFRRVLSHTHQIYGHIERRVHAAGQLPL